MAVCLGVGCSRNIYEIPPSVASIMGPHFELHRDSLAGEIVYGEMHTTSWLTYSLLLCNVRKSQNPEVYNLVRHSGRKVRINGKLYPLITAEDHLFSELILAKGTQRDFSEIMVMFGEMKMIEWTGDSVLSFWAPPLP